MVHRLAPVTAALLALAAAAAGGPFRGYFTLLRPGRPAISHSFLSPPPAAPQLYTRRRDSPIYFISVTSPTHVKPPGVGFIPNPPVDNPFFTVNFPSNGRPAGIFSLSQLASNARPHSTTSWVNVRNQYHASPVDVSAAGRVPASTTLLRIPGSRTPQADFRRSKLDHSLWSR